MIDTSTLKSPEDVLALPDAELVELAAVEVMGWTLNKGSFSGLDYYSDEREDWDYTVWVSEWKPLTDENHTAMIREAKRREWAEEGSCAHWAISDRGAYWWVVVSGFPGEIEPVRIEHSSLARAICAAAVWDSLTKERVG